MLNDMEYVVFVAHVSYVSSRTGKIRTKRLISFDNSELLDLVHRFVTTAKFVECVTRIDYIMRVDYIHLRECSNAL